MARLPHDSSAGQSDSTTHSDTTVLDANSGSTLTLPGHQYITDAQMLRDGQDLVLHPAHGNDVIVKNYFSADPAPLLTSAGGETALTHELVESFVKPVGGIQYAQNGSMDDSSPVGVVKEVSGEGTITHANGTLQKAAIGTPIYEGDIVETKAHGAVNITFVDKTTFAVSENAKMAIDQYVFDPATQHGENNFSVLRGVFVFTSGLIGHADPDDVKINTPVGSIGIRGTTIMGTINPGGDSHVSVVEGAIVVSNTAGEKTLSQQFETVKLNGMNQPITTEGVQSAETMANNYNVLRTVSGPLFSTFDDMGKPGEKPSQDGTPAQDAPAAHDAAPAKDATPPADANAPVNKSDAGQPAAAQEAGTALTQVEITDKASLDSGFDTSAGLKTASIFSGDAGIAAASTTASTTIAAASPSNTAPAAFITPATTAQSPGTVASAPATPSAPAVTTPGLGVTTPSLSALTLAITQIANPTIAVGGVVASITATVTAGLVYSWTSPDDGAGNALFNLTQDTQGRGSITLTSYGVSYVNSLINGGDIVYSVHASLPDGRATTVNSDFLVPASYDLSLNTVITGGVTGAVFIPSTQGESQHGYSLAALGDYNHDGRNDYAFTNNLSSAGSLFIDDGLGNHYQANLSGSPYNFTDTTKAVIASAGDFNGDGKGDIVIGALMSDGGQASSGKVFIMTDPSGAGSGITVTGFQSGNLAGFSVSGLGDYNGDGYNDILISAPYTAGTGAFYVLLGHSSLTPIDVSTLGSNPSLGFKVSGGAGFGTSVVGVGDYNNDGFSDLVTTDPSSGNAFLYYGGPGGTNTGPVNITGLGGNASNKVVALGDANGDSYSDFGLFSVDSDKFYVFNGGANSSTPFSVTSANYTFTSADGTITNVSNAGDFNGDGLNDIALAIRNGKYMDIYIVYGSQSLSGTLDPETMNNIYKMHLDLSSGQFNLANPLTDVVSINISSAGDLNGDGYDDLLIGLPNIDSNGGTHTNDGGILIVNGSASPGSITAGSNATASFQSLVGTTGVDAMSNGNAAITNVHINSGAGNDSITLFGSFGASLIDGGTGLDTLHLATNVTYDMRNVDLSNIEKISLDGNGQVLVLGLDQVFNLLHGSENNALYINATGTSGQFSIDTDKTGSTMTAAGFTDAGVSGNYHMYAQGQYTLYVDTTVTTLATNI